MGLEWVRRWWWWPLGYQVVKEVKKLTGRIRKYYKIDQLAEIPLFSLSLSLWRLERRPQGLLQGLMLNHELPSVA